MGNDSHWMEAALQEARQSLLAPSSSIPSLAGSNTVRVDVPVGAVCVHQGKIVGRGCNRREADSDPTAHAEVLALRQAARALGRWRLDDVTLYVTLEPCPMCAGAIWLARLERVVFGAWDARAGACGSVFDIPRDPRLNHRPQVRGGVLEQQCAELLTGFFEAQRVADGPPSG